MLSIQESLLQLQTITLTTFKEALRKKLLFFLIAVVFCILSFSLLLGQLSLGEQIRITINWSLAATQISLLILAVFLGAQLIASDLEKKTLLTILVRPLQPSLFFLGRYLGLSFILLFSACFFALMLGLFYTILNIPFTDTLWLALFGMYLESLLILAFVLFFSSYSNSFLVLCLSFSIFVIGHFVDSLSYFIKDIKVSLLALVKILILFFPNLEKVNWKSAVVYGDTLSGSEVLKSCFYIFFWLLFILSLSLLILENKDYE